jgi:DNA repair protein RecO (recombination protein O)
MEKAVALHGVQALAALLRLLPERDAHSRLFEFASDILDAFVEPRLAAARMARFEVLLLEDLGFGLDLDQCAVTGSNDDLAYVSPRTGRAVSRSTGEPYAARLLSLPSFLLDDVPAAVLPSDADVAAAFRLTGYFLARHAFDPRGEPLPAARAAFLGWLNRTTTVAAA